MSRREEEIGEDHPFVLQMQHQAAEARAVLEALERELVDRDGSEAGERNLESVVVKECDTGEGEAKQNEFDRYTER
jgi:hypothetical protein